MRPLLRQRILGDPVSDRPRGFRYPRLVRNATALLLLALACNGGPDRPRADGGARDGATQQDGAARQDAVGPIFADFTATGCALADDGAWCGGMVPLTVRFVPIVAPSVETYAWDFGDGSEPSAEVTPSHTYLLPGNYDVTLTVAGPGGADSHISPAFIRVDPAPTGAPCTDGAQCAWGLCVCDDGDCAIPLDAGLCSRGCQMTPCADGERCVDLALAGAATDSWRDTLCLPACESDADCERPGFACLSLPLPSAKDGFARACFPPLLAEIGGACVDPAGRPDDGRCAGGLCLAAGALGLCSADCESRLCGDAASCAAFGADALPRCLARCDDAFACDADPLLACEPPDASGDWGFTTPDDAAHCAPRRCTIDDDCAPPLGRCDLDSGGFCVAAS